MRFAEEGGELYCVGWLAALRHPRGRRARALKRELRYCVSWAKKGNWRAVRKTFNGWMYEPIPWPQEARRCGTGWTKSRAVRRFYRDLHKAVHS